VAVASRRPHTGRARNDAAREAILTAAASLLGDADVDEVTIDEIAAAARVGRQTIYRWWASKGALLLEAMRERGRIEVPAPHRGSLAADLEAFLVETFRRARRPGTAALLRRSMREAQADTVALAALRQFTADRRQALAEVFDEACERGELAPTFDPTLQIDQAFGVLWYRLLLGHAPLTSAAAQALAHALTRQAQADSALDVTSP
jgi:AcrR family transcriptional regulator